MGEIAEMMLDGTMCQGCGEFLHNGPDGPGADGPGYPMYCSACEPGDDKARHKKATAPRDRSAGIPCPACGKKVFDDNALKQHRWAEGH